MTQQLSSSPMLSWHEARTRITETMKRLSGEHIALQDAVGRVLIKPIHARRGSPAFDNSAMDGYALRCTDIAPESTNILKVIETIAAGSMPTKTLAAKECSRIFTGAPMPDGADAVVMQEDTAEAPMQEGFKSIQLTGDIKFFSGKHVRKAHEDIDPGEILLKAGNVLTPGDIGVLAGQGYLRLDVVRKPRVAIVPTGDEIVPIDMPLRPGEVPNSNSAMLIAQVQEAGGIAIEFPCATDNAQSLGAIFAEAAAAADIIVSSGGVSVGDYDHVRTVLGDRGGMDFWKVRIKPGKPLAFGVFDDAPLIGLPGNPVSSYVCFELFVRPALRKMLGHVDLMRPTRIIKMGAPIRRNAGRLEFVRCRLLAPQNEGELPVALPCRHQGSGHLSSMMQVDALLPIEPGDDTLEKGAEHTAIMMR